MNSRFVPDLSDARPIQQAAPPAAIVTASYAPDFERCRLLCDTMDARVSGMSKHYLLVAHHDVALFRTLESRNRVVVDERDILPSWLHSLPDPSSLFRRRIWLSTRTKPLRGWHVQQLRRIAIAKVLEEQTLVYCDSDMAFVRPLDCGRFWRDGRVRLFRRDNALAGRGHEEHRLWSTNAGKVVGIPADLGSMHDYIATLAAWRRASVVALCDHIEALHGKDWVQVVAATRRFSECMIYGRFVDEILGGRHHFVAHEEFCRTYWSGPALDEAGIRRIIETMSPEQAAIGIQSFTGTDTASLRRLLGLA